ncbi:MAG: hypothetical protein DRI86_14295 [Bacteroidetes bacterium]|nr:MAG: hypothetical protein DRI86_14295 [Bacteroidota bacterium]
MKEEYIYMCNAGRIALCESWAEHIGKTIAHETYPTNNLTSIIETYIERLDKTWNEVPNHIPIGLYHDLIDGGTEPISWNRDWSSSTTVLDNVSGFSNHQMFQCLNSNTVDIDDFKQLLISDYLNTTSNTTNEVDLLFNSY